MAANSEERNDASPYPKEHSFFWKVTGLLQLFVLVIVLSTKQAILVQVWTGPERSKRLRLPDFETIGT